MIIKSKFKDYYDHVAFAYGGGDPKVVYDRKPIELDKYCSLPPLPKLPHISLPNTTHSTFGWVCVVGKLYLIVFADPLDKGILFSREKHSHLVDGQSYNNRFYFSRIGISSIDEYTTGFENKEALKICREIKTPVFLYSQNTHIMESIPKLGEMGFASVMPPEQMYQDIAYFMGNTINESPDMLPPTTMTDKERVLQHGFDTKISFRHRI